MKNTVELKGTDLDFAVALAEGVAVVHHKGHIAQCHPFSPEGPANDFHPQNRCMWRFYEPSKDWSIAGPIIERERLTLANSSDPTPYWWANFMDDNYNILYEVDGDTALEAAMRSYCLKIFGATIDFSQPQKERTAIVRISGMREVMFAGDDNFLDKEVEITAVTTEQAEQKAKHHPLLEGFGFAETIFLRWK